MIINCKCDPELDDWIPVHVYELGGVWYAEAYSAGVNTYSGFTTLSATDDGYVYVSVYGESAVNSVPPQNNLYYNTATGAVSWKASAGAFDYLIARYYDQTSTIVMYELPEPSVNPEDLEYLSANNSIEIEVESGVLVEDEFNLLIAVGYDILNEKYIPIDSGSPGDDNINFVGFGQQQSSWSFGGGVYTADFILTGLIPVGITVDSVSGTITPGALVYANKLGDVYQLTTDPTEIATSSKLIVGNIYNTYYDNGLPVPGAYLLIRSNPIFIGV